MEDAVAELTVVMIDLLVYVTNGGLMLLYLVAENLPAILSLVSAVFMFLVLDSEVDPQVAPAHRADPVRLRQVVGNFLSNAIKFTDHGKVTVAVKLLQHMPGEGGLGGAGARAGACPCFARVPSGARVAGPRRNSLRSLRELRSDKAP